MSELPPPIPAIPALPATPPLTPGRIGGRQYEPGPAGEFRIGDAFSLGWTAMTAQYGVLLGALVVCGLISIAGYVLASFIPLVGSFAGFLIAPLGFGLSFTFVRAVRGNSVEVMEFFTHLKNTYWQVVLINLLLTLISFAALLPFGVAIVFLIFVLSASGGASAPVAIAILAVLGIACVLGSLYFQARLAFAPLLYLDAPPGSLEIMEALKLSWRRTADAAWPLVGLAILLVIVNVATLLLLVVGAILLGAPLSAAVNAAAYDLICPVGRDGLCPKCGYDCRGTGSAVCPECGDSLFA
ncbi:hypothetical protein PHYC_03058 [Phycisphaerales bacterium]|nr:hypothetical protein PHYC_03058 [Phycisphaerales bacterium]